MSETTNIEWAQHTGGPYLGCSKVSPGCANCYAWVLMLQRLAAILRKAYKLAGFADWETRPVWGDNAPRVLSKGFWTDVRRINKQHEKSGTRGRWFPSMIDWLDLMPAGIIDQDGNKLDPTSVLADFLGLVHECQSLDFLLLTKRPQNFLLPLMARVLDCVGKREGFPKAGKPSAFGDWLVKWVEGSQVPENVWIGVSVEDQKRADERIPLLLKIPAKVRFLSVEPLLERVKLDVCRHPQHHGEFPSGIHWIIVGGESGPGRRDCGWQAIRDVAEQCVRVHVPVFVKQASALKPGQQGDLPSEIWALKQFPR